MKQKKNQNLSDSEKEKIYDNLLKLVRDLDKKEKKIMMIQVTLE